MVRFSTEHPRLIAAVVAVATIVLAAFIPKVKIDTDPENMLPGNEPVRVFHDRMKQIMSLNDMIVVGIVNEKNETDGVFTPDSLKKIHALTRFARGLRWRSPDDPARYDFAQTRLGMRGDRSLDIFLSVCGAAKAAANA